MKATAYTTLLVLFCVGVHAQDAATAHTRHGKCAENDEPVVYPLKGLVRYANTAESVSDMTVQALISPDKPPAATAKTDAAGRFSFPTLSPRRYYLRAAKVVGGAKISAEDVVTVSKGKSGIDCLVAEAEAIEQSPPR